MNNRCALVSKIAAFQADSQQPPGIHSTGAAICAARIAITCGRWDAARSGLRISVRTTPSALMAGKWYGGRTSAEQCGYLPENVPTAGNNANGADHER